MGLEVEIGFGKAWGGAGLTHLNFTVFQASLRDAASLYLEIHGLKSMATVNSRYATFFWRILMFFPLGDGA